MRTVFLPPPARRVTAAVAPATVLAILGLALGPAALAAVLPEDRADVLYHRYDGGAHIHQKRCLAGVCKPLITYAIDAEQCKGCGLCLTACPHGAITGEKKQAHVIDPQLCNKCGICADECKTQAITVN